MFVKVLAHATMETAPWQRQGCLEGLPSLIPLPAAVLQPCVELFCSHTAALAVLNLVFKNVFFHAHSQFLQERHHTGLQDNRRDFSEWSLCAHIQARAETFPLRELHTSLGHANTMFQVGSFAFWDMKQRQMTAWK